MVRPRGGGHHEVHDGAREASRGEARHGEVDHAQSRRAVVHRGGYHEVHDDGHEDGHEDAHEAPRRVDRGADHPRALAHGGPLPPLVHGAGRHEQEGREYHVNDDGDDEAVLCMLPS